MGLDALNIARTDEEVLEKVGELEKEVSKNQGQLVFSFREIVVEKPSRGCFPRYIPTFDYAETGIINGELTQKPMDFEFDFESCRIPSGDMIFDSRDSVGDYLYLPRLFVPVDKRLTSGRRFLLGLFSAQDLKQAKKGEIGFDRGELKQLQYISGYEKTLPYLRNFYFLIGKSDIREFLRGRRHSEKIDDFLKLMEIPGEIERRVTEYDSEQRNRLSIILTQKVAKMASLKSEIGKVEEMVLDASYYLSGADEDGSKYFNWTNPEEVDKYERLREQVIHLGKDIRKNLGEADKLGLKNYDVDLKHVGAPVKVKGVEYLADVNSLLDNVNTVLRELDSHLEEARRIRKEA